MARATPLLGLATGKPRRGAALVAVLAVATLAALAYQARRTDGVSAMLAGSKGDPFVANFLGKSKNTGLSERKYVHSWVHQVKHGGLFNKLHSFEKSRKLQRKAWREKQLAGITEPSGNSLFNELMRTRDRAVGAATSREGADKLQHRTDQEMGARDARGRKNEVDFGAYRHHADAIAPKYAGKRTLPIVHHEIPKMDAKVGALMHDLGEAHPQRGAHLRAHAQLKGEGKAATSQLAARPAPAHVPGEEMAVQQEIAAAKKAARNPTYRAAFKPKPRGLFRGGSIEENVEREIAAARQGAHHHLPYGRVPGHGEAAGTKPGDGLARELEAARNAAQQDAKMKRARHLQKETSAEKRAVAVEDAYSMPNGDSRSSARGGGAWANKLQKVAQ